MNAAPPRYADLYPALAHCSPLPDAPGSGIAPIQVPAGTELFSENAPCRGFPLVLEGEVKVSRHSGDGRSLELYRVVPGELCLVSSACLFRSQPLSASGVATRPTKLLLIPPPVFNQWLEAPAFRKLDQRLAAALLGRGQDIGITHQQLADELGTVREIVTRLLRRFEREGWVELAREHIHIIDSAALRTMAAALQA